MPVKVLAETLPERITRFVESFDPASAEQKYNIRVIQTGFPTKLISPEYLLPQTSNYPLNDIQQLYRLSKTCSGTLPLSPLVTEPLVFVRAMCKSTPLPKTWFSRTGLIHPGGGSYAARYAKKHPKNFESLQKYMHIQERPKAKSSTLLGQLQRMEFGAIAALIAGEQLILDKKTLWLRKGDNYYLYPARVWQSNTKSAEINLQQIQGTNTCLVRRGNLCISEQDRSNMLMKGLVALAFINVALIIGWSVYRWDAKRREMKNRMLVLQILTHELRTPIASLSVTVEGFRREFEKLPESVYDQFRRLCEDSRRLRQLAEASKDYLQSEHQNLATEWIPSVESWLKYRYEEDSDKLSLSISEDIAVKVNIYWLGTCLDNLVNNAFKYGVSPVELKVSVKGNLVSFSVIDQGALTHKDWKRLKKPFASDAGLGLGLTIVESMVNRMGGKMSLSGPPTTFTLEISCETDTATR
ncbi:sensor histidine kinase [Vibrio sp. JC009]|uniref:sensor histidine kinase VxrA n=1 Tax=Vibrio sp. JC009 TaxID=2912314 RepID=UPI0023AF5E96|nr:sensor histidine kinase VxrA [Vibrio sp. JC009]WED24371.1 sensor histidine kinase [Vibrio sp. JC009]